MNKIEKLTPEQQVAHDEWLAECMRIGTCTDPADRKKAESAIGKMYQFIGKPIPTFVWCDSPATCILAQFVLQEWLKVAKDGSSLRSSLESSLWSSLRSSLESSLWSSLESSLESSLRSSLESSLRSSLRSSLWSSLESSLGSSLWSSLESSLESSLWSSLESSLESSLWSSLGSSLWSSLGSSLWSSLESSLGSSLRSSLESSLWSSLRSSLESSLRSSLWSSLESSLGSSLESSLWSSNWGQQEQYWIGFYRFMELTLKIQYDPEKSTHLGWWQDIAESANWWFPYEGFCFVSERPIRCTIDEQRRLHNESVAAMEFKDGWKVYSYHGTSVPAQVIESPETISVEQIKKEDNAEVRRCMVERMGWSKFVEISELKTLHTDTLKTRFPLLPISELVNNSDPAALQYQDGEEQAELLESAFLKDFEDRPIRFVRLTCPSTGKQYIQRVSHDETRVYAAVGKAFGMTEQEYKNGRFYRQGDVLLWSLDQEDERIIQQHS